MNTHKHQDSINFSILRWMAWAGCTLSLFFLGCSPAAADLVAHWTFDESIGNVAHDSAGTSDGTLSPTGSRFVAGGVSGNAVGISQVANGFVTMGNILSFSSGDFSFSMWIKLNVGDITANTIVLGKQDAGYINGYLMIVNRGGNGGEDNKALFYAGGLATDGARSRTTVNDGNWHHLSGVYKAGISKVIYVDGVAEDTNSAPVVIGNSAQFLVGGVNEGVPISRFTGLVDDVQAYNHALSTAEVRYLYEHPGTPVTASPQRVTPLAHWTFDESSGSLARDSIGAFDGTLSPTGSSFVPNGVSGNAISLSKTANGFVSMGDILPFTTGDFSASVWIRMNPGDTAETVVLGKQNSGDVNGYLMLINRSGNGGQDNKALFYGGGLATDGSLSTASVNDGNWHHLLGVYRAGVSKVIYVDGVAEGTSMAPPINGNTAPFLVGGANMGNPTSRFTGLIDDLQIYGSGLAPDQVAYLFHNPGKDLMSANQPPVILSQPDDQTALVGHETEFVARAVGAPPLSYQWNFNGSSITDATNSSLRLVSVQLTNAGVYAVQVSNLAGITLSSNATLTVKYPPAQVRVLSTTAEAVGTATVPVMLTANGNENAVGFSLNFDASRLTYSGISLGSGAVGASLLVNDREASSGRLGVAVGLTAGGLFAAGSNEVVQVIFTSVLVMQPTTALISFGDIPIVREVSDAPGQPLAATYSSGTVSIAAAKFEADLSPRPNGDQILSVTDWVLAGRFAARLDYPTNATEFQRTDCAPRSDLGDGAITVTDWVQAGRYIAGLDALTPVGGPASEKPPGGALRSSVQGDGARRLVISDGMLLQGQTVTVSANLIAQGDENAMGFSLRFDPALLTYTGATLGSGVPSATLNVNATQVASGRLGFVLALNPGGKVSVGSQELVKVSFGGATSNSCSTPVSPSDQPVPRQVSDSGANALQSEYSAGNIVVNPVPALSIERAGESVVLRWPLWASNFRLQEAVALATAVEWTDVEPASGTNGSNRTVTLPVGTTSKLYRLRLH